MKNRKNIQIVNIRNKKEDIIRNYVGIKKIIRGYYLQHYIINLKLNIFKISNF